MEEKIDLLIKYIMVRDAYESIHRLVHEEVKAQGWSKRDKQRLNLNNRRHELLQQLGHAIGYDIDKEFS